MVYFKHAVNNKSFEGKVFSLRDTIHTYDVGKTFAL